MKYCPRPRQVRPGNRVVLLVGGGQAYPEMLDAIEGARHHINLAVYIFRNDTVGTRFAEALARAVERGVEVNVVYDAMGCLETPRAFFDDLEAKGVHVLEYHPLRPWRPRWAWFNRDHRKILVVDGGVGFTGGINICDDEAPESWQGKGWRDLHVRVDGPAVRDLQRAFRRIWRQAHGRRMRARHYLRVVEPAGTSPVRVVGNFGLWNRLSIHRAMTRAIGRSRKFIYIENAYFLPGERLLRGLLRAAARGVQVRIVVAGKSDIPIIARATRALYPRLLAAGVQIFEWNRTVLHSKAACIDGLWSEVGTYNLDHWSALRNLEIAVNVFDPAFATTLATELEQAQAASHRIDVPPRLGLWGRFVDWVLLLISRWL